MCPSIIILCQPQPCFRWPHTCFRQPQPCSDSHSLASAGQSPAHIGHSPCIGRSLAAQPSAAFTALQQQEPWPDVLAQLSATLVTHCALGSKLSSSLEPQLDLCKGCEKMKRGREAASHLRACNTRGNDPAGCNVGKSILSEENESTCCQILCRCQCQSVQKQRIYFPTGQPLLSFSNHR